MSSQFQVYPGALKKLKQIKNERVKQAVREESKASVEAALLLKQKVIEILKYVQNILPY